MRYRVYVRETDDSRSPCPNGWGEAAWFFLPALWQSHTLRGRIIISETLAPEIVAKGASWPVRRIAILPTLLTLGNAVCGFASIHYASKIKLGMGEEEVRQLFWIGGVLIFAAMVFDVLDGYVARLSKSASDFGGQLDSLCDAISFGLAPAFLLLRMCQEWIEPPFKHGVVVIAALYMVCALLRLARFNLENSPDPNSHKRFKGLPSPAAAGCLGHPPGRCASAARSRAGTRRRW